MSKELLIQDLNQDLTAEWSTIARYMVQANQVRDKVGNELHHIFLQEVEDRLEHITYLTDIIVRLGGQPTTVAEVYETMDDLPAMLKLDLSLESEQVERYRQHAKLAAELGQDELKRRLETIAANEAKYVEVLRHLINVELPAPAS